MARKLLLLHSLDDENLAPQRRSRTTAIATFCSAELMSVVLVCGEEEEEEMFVLVFVIVMLLLLRLEA